MEKTFETIEFKQVFINIRMPLVLKHELKLDLIVQAAAYRNKENEMTVDFDQVDLEQTFRQRWIFSLKITTLNIRFFK